MKDPHTLITNPAAAMAAPYALPAAWAELMRARGKRVNLLRLQRTGSQHMMRADGAHLPQTLSLTLAERADLTLAEDLRLRSPRVSARIKARIKARAAQIAEGKA